MLKRIKIKITDRPAYNLRVYRLTLWVYLYVFEICAIAPLINSNPAELGIFQASVKYCTLEAEGGRNFQPPWLPVPAALLEE